MKIIDETGAVVENPDLTLGYLTGSTEEITHPAVEGVEELFHYETVTEYPNGGKDVQKIIDRPGVTAQEEWVEKVPIQKYIRYTAEELAEIKESLRTEKLKEVSADCEKAIYAGVDVIFADESQKHFSLQPNDQTNIDGVFNAIVLGATEYPYHADGEPCKMYSAADIVSLYVASKGYITKQTTYNNALRQQIRREDDSDALKSIKYGVDLPDDLNEDMNEILVKANEQVQSIVSKLTNLAHIQ